MQGDNTTGHIMEVSIRESSSFKHLQQRTLIGMHAN